MPTTATSRCSTVPTIAHGLYAVKKILGGSIQRIGPLLDCVQTAARPPERYPMSKLWSHSGDSHFMEPAGLWHEILPPALADRMPRSERVAEDEEIVHVDGQSFRRR